MVIRPTNEVIIDLLQIDEFTEEPRLVFFNTCNNIREPLEDFLP